MSTVCAGAFLMVLAAVASEMASKYQTPTIIYVGIIAVAAAGVLMILAEIVSQHQERNRNRIHY